MIAAPVNSAYRGDSSRVGWTNEADLFDGQRTDEKEVRDLLNSKESMFLLCLRGTDLVGSVLLRKKGTTAYLGMLVVNPQLQRTGNGSSLIAASEAAVRNSWGMKRISMTVISCRSELIAFYERRGYCRTGLIEPLPTGSPSVARVAGLELEVLEKELE